MLEPLKEEKRWEGRGWEERNGEGRRGEYGSDTV